MKRCAPLGIIGLGVLLLAACDDTTNANQQEQQTTLSALQQLLQSQPVPQFKWSQIRQTLIDIETAQAKTTQTTSFAFNQGVADPVWSCPSIGFPIATTSELTNPHQISQIPYVGGDGRTYSDSHESVNGITSQIDPNGIYAGNSTGTYVLCVANDGTTFVQYWEGFVETVSGPAVWDAGAHQVRLTGPSTVAVQTQK
jgi:hypothetical protein